MPDTFENAGKLRLLNLGCGDAFHTEWVNVDIFPTAASVQRWDVTHPLPFPAEEFDACYCSHLLEHLDPFEADRLIVDCRHVLKRGGILRVVVPDLERIVRVYLHILADLDAGRAKREQDYDWIMLEFFDQMVRTRPGGEMGRYLSQIAPGQRDFILSRIGMEAERFWAKAASRDCESLIARPRRYRLDKILGRFRQLLAEHVVYVVGGALARDAFREGMFRKSGEVHRWMYDRFSLVRLLRKHGFSEIRVCFAFESRIPGFARFELDMQGEKVRKPDSLFVEGIRA